MIDRKKYLEMCQAVSVLPSGILGIKCKIPDNLKVEYQGNIYYPLSLEIGFDSKGRTINTAIIHSLKANSVSKINLMDIKIYENKRID